MGENRVKDHYDNHLGKIYSWMFGDFETKVEENLTLFREQNILPCRNRLAFDLGAGSGFQTMALAKLGFQIKSVDFCQNLLDELEGKIAGSNLKVDLVLNDLILYLKTSKLSPELIVCMGDTLTHLPDEDSARELIQLGYKTLEPGGRLVVSYRDLSEELVGENRFFTVRSDNNRIFACFLEYFENRVRVNDIIYQKINGVWEHKINHYEKLRLPVSLIDSWLHKGGFENTLRLKKTGFDIIIAQKES